MAVGDSGGRGGGRGVGRDVESRRLAVASARGWQRQWSRISRAISDRRCLIPILRGGMSGRQPGRQSGRLLTSARRRWLDQPLLARRDVAAIAAWGWRRWRWCWCGLCMGVEDTARAAGEPLWSRERRPTPTRVSPRPSTTTAFAVGDRCQGRVRGRLRAALWWDDEEPRCIEGPCRLRRGVLASGAAVRWWIAVASSAPPRSARGLTRRACGSPCCTADAEVEVAPQRLYEGDRRHDLRRRWSRLAMPLTGGRAAGQRHQGPGA